MSHDLRQEFDGHPDPSKASEVTVQFARRQLAIKPGTVRINDFIGGVVADDAEGLLKDLSSGAVVGGVNYESGEFIGPY